LSSIKLTPNASGTGAFTIAAPNSNTDRTLTLPDATGTILTTATPGVPVNGPAFSAYMGANQTVTSATWTKVQFNTELFDTAGNFNTSTYAFTPTVAGYYQINFLLSFAPNTATALGAELTKNGLAVRRVLQYALTAGQLDDWCVTGSALIYMNGSTDYLDMYGYVVSGSPAFAGIYPFYSAFEAFLARSAA
jgi:hypothetical protein